MKRYRKKTIYFQLKNPSIKYVMIQEGSPLGPETYKNIDIIQQMIWSKYIPVIAVRWLSGYCPDLNIGKASSSLSSAIRLRI